MSVSVLGAAPISIAHHLLSSVKVLGPYLYQSVIFLSVQFELGPHLYRSIIHLVNSFWVFELRPHLYRSVICLVSFSSVRVRTAPILIGHSFVLSVWVWVFWVAPISIGHLPINLCLVWVFRTASISIGHSSYQFEFSLSFWDSTYINRSFILSVQFEFSGLYLYRSVIVYVSLSF